MVSGSTSACSRIAAHVERSAAWSSVDSTGSARSSTAAPNAFARARPRVDVLQLSRPRQDTRMRALVTGGGGLHRLESRPRPARSAATRVRVLDNFSTGSPREPREIEADIEVVGRVSSGATSASVRGARESRLVFHLGALGSVPRSVQDPLTSSAGKRRGTLNAPPRRPRRGGPPRRLQLLRPRCTGRAAHYRPPSPNRARSDLAVRVAKLAAERYCVSSAGFTSRSRPVVLRYFNVSGPDRAPTRSTRP
jgi:UDP-glucose 4-epimerase